MVQRGHLPPNLWLNLLNPNIDLAGFEAFLPNEASVLCSERRASVSSFGFSGTNGHACIEAAPPSTAKIPTATYSRRVLKPVQEWLQKFLYLEQWVPVPCQKESSQV